MNAEATVYRGGCLCGALRYVATGEPSFGGLCYCADCRKASGAGFIPFMGFPRERVRFTGPSSRFESISRRGGPAVRNACPICSSLVFGGERDSDDSHTVYAGTLDAPAAFRPTIAIFTEGRPDWAVIPEGLTIFDAGPG